MASSSSPPPSSSTHACANSHHHHHHAHAHPHPQPLRYSQPTQADEDLLDLLTSGAFSPASVSASSASVAASAAAAAAAAATAAAHLQHASTVASRRPLSTLAALRRPALDPIVLAATLSSGPHITRHHFHHSFDGKPPDSSRSQQMPASVRRARIKEQEEHQHDHPTAQVQQHRSPEPAPASIEPLPASLGSSPERPRYVSAQAPRSVRLAREVQPTDLPSAAPPQTLSAAALAAAAVTDARSPSAQTDSANHTASMRRFPFPPPPLFVRCHARTRIPTPHGEVFAYIYKNNRDLKEHLALVVDPAQNDEVASEYYRRRAERALQSNGSKSMRVQPRRREIRSRSLDEVWGPDETDMERIVRGAYVGRLSGDYQIASAPPAPLHARRTVGMGGNEAGADTEEEEDDDDDALDPPLVRIHSECYTGETIGSQRCDCGEQLDEAIRLIAAEDEIMHPPRQRSSHHHGHHHRRSQPGVLHHKAVVGLLDHSVDSLAQSTTLSAYGGAETNPHTPLLTGAPPSPSASQQLLPALNSSSTPAEDQEGRPRPRPRRARGIIVYLRQEGRGIGLLDKLMAYNLQDMGHDTVSANILLGHSADARTYDIAAAILRDLGVGTGTGTGAAGARAAHGGVRLLTNNPEKVEGMEREGVRVVERVPMVPRMWRVRREKQDKKAAAKRRRRRRRRAKRKEEERRRLAEGGGGVGGEAKVLSRARSGSRKTPSPLVLGWGSGASSRVPASPGLASGGMFRPSLLGVHSHVLSSSSSEHSVGSEGGGGRRPAHDGDEEEDGELEMLSQAGGDGDDGSMSASASASATPLRFRFMADDDDGTASQREEVGGSTSDSDAHAHAHDDDDSFEDEDDDEDDSEDDEDDSDSDSGDSYTAHVLRRSGATMIGADVTRSVELEKYLRTKVERMGHMLDVPTTTASSSSSSPVAPVAMGADASTNKDTATGHTANRSASTTTPSATR